MYDVKRKKAGFDFLYFGIVLILLGTTFYFMDTQNWSAIKASGFPMYKHILSRLAFVWSVFWPAITLTLLYPLAKGYTAHTSWGPKFLSLWKIGILLLICVLWYALYYGS